MSIDPGLFDGRYLIPGEDREEFLALVEDHRRRYITNFMSECIVSNMIHEEWSLRRYRKASTQLTEMLRQRAPGAVLPPEVNHTSFQNIQKIMGMIQRRYDSNLRLVLKLKKESQPKQSKARSAKLASFRQNSEAVPGPYLVTPPPPKTKPN